MRTIAIANQKGGCGKTTTAVNLSAALAERGKRTLLVDFDPQGHSTIGLGCEPDELNTTIYEVLLDDNVGIETITIKTKVELLYLIPSNVLLSGAELDLASVNEREFILKKKLARVHDEYEYCIIDCAPSLGLLTLNALFASTGVIIPVQSHYYSTEGLRQFFETANTIEERYSPCSLNITGVLLTLAEKNTLLSRNIIEQMRELFGNLVFDTVIHKSVRLAEAPSAAESILTYAPDSKSAAEYRALANELINRWNPTEQTSASNEIENHSEVLIGGIFDE